MALPKLNDAPIYNLTIPSSKKKIKYRPYLVKEEKVLMIAAEQQDTKQAMSAILNTLINCIQDKIDPNSLTTFDVEYMFTQVRAKSVGESVDMTMPCSECKVPNEVSIALDKLTVKVPNDWQDPVQLNEDTTVELKYPSYTDICELDMEALEKNQIESTFSIATKCIHAVSHEDERTLAEDCTNEELTDFINSMNAKQFSLVSDFVNTMPKLKHDIKFDCSSCSAKNQHTLEGINSFF